MQTFNMQALTTEKLAVAPLDRSACFRSAEPPVGSCPSSLIGLAFCIEGRGRYDHKRPYCRYRTGTTVPQLIPVEAIEKRLHQHHTAVMSERELSLRLDNPHINSLWSFGPLVDKSSLSCRPAAKRPNVSVKVKHALPDLLRTIKLLSPPRWQYSHCPLALYEVVATKGCTLKIHEPKPPATKQGNVLYESFTSVNLQYETTRGWKDSKDLC